MNPSLDSILPFQYLLTFLLSLTYILNRSEANPKHNVMMRRAGLVMSTQVLCLIPQHPTTGVWSTLVHTIFVMWHKFCGGCARTRRWEGKNKRPNPPLSSWWMNIPGTISNFLHSQRPLYIFGDSGRLFPNTSDLSIGRPLRNAQSGSVCKEPPEKVPGFFGVIHLADSASCLWPKKQYLWNGSSVATDCHSLQLYVAQYNTKIVFWSTI